MFDASLLLLKRNARESPADGCDLLQFWRSANPLRDRELLPHRERNSPALAVFRSEAGVISAAESPDRITGLLSLGKSFCQSLPGSPTHLPFTIFDPFFELAVQTFGLLLLLRGFGFRFFSLSLQLSGPFGIVRHSSQLIQHSGPSE